MKPHKVFGIGFHKTGTKSLAQALRRLGYRVKGPVGTKDADISRAALRHASELVPEFDAFQDNPWPIIYRELDGLFPDSKFILTIRPTDEWISSVVSHFGASSTAMREWIYGVGSPRDNEAIYIARYENHNREVVEYFKDRPDDLLVYNLTDIADWGPLCSFLNEPLPDEPFPHANTAADVAARREERKARRGKTNQ